MPVTSRISRFTRTCLRLALRTALLVLLVVELVYLGREPLLADLVRRAAAQAVEQALGGRIELGPLEGDWLRHVRCRGIEYAGPGVLRVVHGGELELHISPLRLLAGDLAGLRAARFTAATVELALDAVGPGSRADAPATPPDAALQEQLARLCGGGARITVERCSLRGQGHEQGGRVDLALAPRTAPETGRSFECDAPQFTARGAWRPASALQLDLRCGDLAGWLAPLGIALPAGVAPGPLHAALDLRGAEATLHGEARVQLPAWSGAGGACAVAATLRGAPSQIQVTTLALQAAAWRIDAGATLDLGLAELLAHPRRVRTAALRVDAVLSRADLGGLTPAAPGVDLTAVQVAGALTVRGTLAAPDPSLDLTVACPRLALAGAPPAAIAGQVHVDPQRVLIQSLRVRGADQELELAAEFHTERPLWQAPLEGRFGLRATPRSGGTVAASGRLDLAGVHDGQVTLHLPGLTAHGTDVAMAWREASFAEALAHARGTLAVDLTSVPALRAALPPALLPSAQVLPADLTLRVRAALAHGWLDVPVCEAAGAGLALRTLPMSMPLAPTPRRDGHAALWLALLELPRVPWPAELPAPRSGLISLVVDGRPDHFHGAGSLDLHVRDAWRSGRVFGRVALGWQDGLVLAPDLTAVTTWPGIAGLVQVRGNVALDQDARLAGAELALGWDGTATGLGGTPVRARADLAADRQRIRGTLAVSHGTLQMAGELALLGGTVLDLPDAPTALCAAPLAGALRVTALDLATLDPHRFGLDDLGGTADGVLELSGTLAHPEPRLRARVTGGFVRAAAAPRVEQIEARITASPAQLRIEELHASSGLGPLSAHGTLDLPGSWTADLGQARVALTIQGTDVLLYRRGGVKVRGDLDLLAQGPLSAVKLGGKVAVHSARYLAHIPYWDPTRAGGDTAIAGLVLEGPRLRPWAHVQLDVAVQTGEPFQIDTNVLKTRVSGALRLVGPLEAPRLEGNLSASEGSLALPGMTFQLQSLLVHLDRDRPRFPVVTLQAQGRRHGYDVTLRVRGSLDDPEIVLSATPPLTPEQLAVLVTTGSAPGATDRDRLLGAGTALGSYLVTEIADYLFGSESTEAKESFLARLRVETGTEVSRSGNETILAEFRLFDRFYLQGERDIHNQMNLGLVYRVKFR